MKKYKIGYTQGVYDMFHIGHLHIINRAAEQCEYLIVGVNSDALVEAYKGKKTVIGQNDRAEIIRNLKNAFTVTGTNGFTCIRVAYKRNNAYAIWRSVHKILLTGVRISDILSFVLIKHVDSYIGIRTFVQRFPSFD